MIVFHIITFYLVMYTDCIRLYAKLTTGRVDGSLNLFVTLTRFATKWFFFTCPPHCTFVLLTTPNTGRANNIRYVNVSRIAGDTFDRNRNGCSIVKTDPVIIIIIIRINGVLGVQVCAIISEVKWNGQIARRRVPELPSGTGGNYGLLLSVVRFPGRYVWLC